MKSKSQGRLLGSASHEAFRSLDAELWLADRLKSHGVDVFDGDSTTVSRSETIRAAIRKNKLDSVVLGKRNGTVETYATAFERIYQQSLVQRGTNIKRKTG